VEIDKWGKIVIVTGPERPGEGAEANEWDRV
jgi:hypothetical protein